jgi:hypothetical protein
VVVGMVLVVLKLCLYSWYNYSYKSREEVCVTIPTKAAKKCVVPVGKASARKNGFTKS